MWSRHPDGSVVDASGKVIAFGAQRFLTDICFGHCCFICGAQPGTRDFNNEHVLPDWLLRRYNLYSRQITLPYGHTVRYGTYTVPCCKDCNSMMGEVIERPLSEAVRGGSRAIKDLLREGFLKIFLWMGLIYLKTHLKDRAMRVHLDERKGSEKIGDDYDWETLHHIHAIVRSFFSGCIVETAALGSFLGIAVDTSSALEGFDFADLYLAQTMLIRLDDIALCCVFNDSGASLANFRPVLSRIDAPISPLQLREIMTEFAWLNLRLRNRPTFATECDLEGEACRIVGPQPELDLAPLDLRLRGRLLRQALGSWALAPFANCTQEEGLAAIDAGTMTFLFDENGEFIKNSVVKS